MVGIANDCITSSVLLARPRSLIIVYDADEEICEHVGDRRAKHENCKECGGVIRKRRVCYGAEKEGGKAETRNYKANRR